MIKKIKECPRLLKSWTFPRTKTLQDKKLNQDVSLK